MSMPSSYRRVEKEGLRLYHIPMSHKDKGAKKGYKDIIDRAQRSGAGNESDTEEDLPSDFPYYSQIDAVMAGRPAVTSVHLLDSASHTEENEIVSEHRRRKIFLFRGALQPRICACTAMLSA